METRVNWSARLVLLTGLAQIASAATVLNSTEWDFLRAAVHASAMYHTARSGATNSTTRKLLASSSGTVSYTCGYTSDSDCYAYVASSSSCGNVPLTCGLLSNAGTMSYCKATADYTFLRCVMTSSLGYTYSQAHTYVSNCAYWNLGESTSTGYHGGDLNQGQCNMPRRPITVSNIFTCDTSNRIEFQIDFTLVDTSKTLLGIEERSSCTSRFRSSEALTYDYSDCAPSYTPSECVRQSTSPLGSPASRFTTLTSTLLSLGASGGAIVLIGR